MERRKELLVMFFIFLFCIFFSGCTKDYLIQREEKLVDRESHPLRSELDVRVVSRDGQGFSLFPQIKNIAFVLDSVKLEELYVHGSEEEGTIMALSGAAIGFGGCIGGFKYAKSGNCLYDDRLSEGCAISFVSGLLSIAMMGKGNSLGSEFIKIMPGFIKRDTVCVDSMFLIKQKIKVLVEDSNFEKTYHTDENGNIELKFNEITPKPTAVDSVLNLIIKYGEMVDSVNVKIMKMGD